MRKTWFEMRGQAPEQAAEIAIYDDIGSWGITAKDFISGLQSVTADTITLSINSPGGAVFDALAIHNALRQHPATINVVVNGVAASAASLIAMAGDKITMLENAFMMIHNPMSSAAGNADELRDLADTLDKIGASLAAIYATRSGQTVEKVRELLAAETWMTAEEAVALGFADEVAAPLPVTARFDLERVPESIRSAWARLAPPPAPQAPAPASATLLPVVDFVAVDKALRAWAERQHIKLAPSIPLISDYHAEIASVCATAGLSELVDVAIDSKIPLAALRHMVMNFRAAQDQAIEINHHIPTDSESLASRVWNQRRGQA